MEGGWEAVAIFALVTINAHHKVGLSAKYTVPLCFISGPDDFHTLEITMHNVCCNAQFLLRVSLGHMILLTFPTELRVRPL